MKVNHRLALELILTTQLMNNKMRITFISDTHSKHKQVTNSLPGGDLIVHAGDMSSQGYKHEIQEFLKWYNNLDNYTNKVE